MSMISSFDQTLSQLGISRYGVSGGPEVKTKAEAETLGQDAFLKLMTAQLRNQDPFKPVENEAMVAQMAQFSSVAGIAEMNQTLKAMAAQLNGSRAAEALGYVGKTVLVEGDVAYPNTAGGLETVVALTDAAEEVEVAISDMDGNLLRTLKLGPQGMGEVEVAWDGKTEAGEAAGDGPFQIAATAIRDGKGAPTPVLVWAPVASVTMPSDGSTPTLNLVGLGARPITAVHQVG